MVLHEPLAYRRGFERIAQHLDREGRPRQALCAIELRLPEPVSFDGFAAFNEGYQALLGEWDLTLDGINPVARTNVAPEVASLAEPVLYAFSYTRAADVSRSTFIVAGAGDVSDLADRAIIRAGETSADAMREKATQVMGKMEARLRSLGVGWSDVTAVDIYTVQTLEAYLRDVVLAPMREGSVHGIHWHYARPPIQGLEFEMDVRGVLTELRLG